MAQTASRVGSADKNMVRDALLMAANACAHAVSVPHGMSSPRRGQGRHTDALPESSLAFEGGVPAVGAGLLRGALWRADNTLPPGHARGVARSAPVHALPPAVHHADPAACAVGR